MEGKYENDETKTWWEEIHGKNTILEHNLFKKSDPTKKGGGHITYKELLNLYGFVFIEFLKLSVKRLGSL